MRSNFINLVKIDVHVDKTGQRVCTKCHADRASKSCCYKVVFFFFKQNLLHIHTHANINNLPKKQKRNPK